MNNSPFLFFLMEVSWRDPKLVALWAEKQAKLSSCLSVGLRPAQQLGDLAGMEGGGIAASRGAEELWEQRPCIPGGLARQLQLMVAFLYSPIKL